MHAVDFLALFLVLTWHTNAPDTRPHLSASYCSGSYFNGPRGWARTKDTIDTDFARYSRSLQVDNCTQDARIIRAELNF